MYTATVPIVSLSSFVPYTPTGQNMTAQFGPPNNTSALPGSTITAPTPNSLLVDVPVGYTGAVQITFQLPRSDYVLVGISVGPVSNPHSKKGPGQSTMGRREFRTVTVNRGAADSQLVVTDACIPEFGGIDFDYLILVQEVSTGQIGAIDPDWETEPGE